MSEYPWDRLTKRQFSEVICCKVHHAFVAFELHTKFGTPDQAKSDPSEVLCHLKDGEDTTIPQSAPKANQVLLSGYDMWVVSTPHLHLSLFASLVN